MSDYFEWLYMTSFYVTIVNKTSVQANWNSGTDRKADRQTDRLTDLGISKNVNHKNTGCPKKSVTSNPKQEMFSQRVNVKE